MRWKVAISLVLAVLISTGCATSAPRQTPNQSSQAGEPAGGQGDKAAGQVDVAEPKSDSQKVVAEFFTAIVQGDRQKALSLWAGPASSNTWIEEWISAKARLSIGIGAAEEKQGRALVPVTITVTELIKSPEGTMWAGLRSAPYGSLFLTVEQKQGDRKITAVSTPT